MNRMPASTARGLQLWQQAERHIAHGHGAEALVAAAQLCALEPRNTLAHLMAAAVAYTQGHLRASAEHAVNASETDIGDDATLGKTVMALLRTGETAKARLCLESPILDARLSGQSLLGYASALQSLGCHAEALELIDRTIKQGTDNATVRFQRAIELMFNGRTTEVEDEIERCLSMGATAGRASLMLSRQRRQTRDNNHVEAIRGRMCHAAPGSEDRAALEFALYKEYEDLERYPDAWQALNRGNRIMASMLRPDATGHSRRINALIERTSSLDPPGKAAPDHGPQPIFIVGMPRSGTTLLDRILGAHGEVTSVGELGDFARQLRWGTDCVGAEYIDEQIIDRLADIDLAEVGERYLLQSRWRSPTRHYVDKLPVNYQFAGLIAHALPQARILHMARDPMATCFSNYRAYFGAGYGYSYDLTALAAHYNDYRRLMRHWRQIAPGRILEVDYGRLTSEPEPVVREVMAFCGLEYEPDCLDLSRNRSPIATLSATQMHSGIRPSEDDVWRHYADELSTLESALRA